MMLFIYKGTELYRIPIESATTENILWTMDTLAECYEIPACSITTKVIKEQIKA